MRITILAIGSRGDVQPYVALGLGLQSIGSVRVAARPAFEGFVRERGLDFWPVAGGTGQVLDSRHGRRWVEQSQNPIRSFRALARAAAPLAHQTTVDCWRASAGADAVVVSPLALVPGYSVAEKLGVPMAAAWYCPTSPTRSYPVDRRLLPLGLPLGGAYNLATHFLGRELLWLLYRPLANRLRRDVLDLPPLPLHEPLWNAAERGLLLYGFSPAVVPRAPDWGERVHVTGYWFLDPPAGWRPPAELVAYLQGGPPPVCVTFGSLSPDLAATVRIAVDALGRAGRRAVLVTGPDGPRRGELPQHVLPVESVPFEWLFPRVSAVVHHGGAGTTALALRAGVPSVVVPGFADQPFWASRVHELGVGPRPIPRRHLAAGPLAEAIRIATGDRSMGERAAALGRLIRAEDGVGRAAEAFRRYVGAAPHRPAKVNSQSSRFG